jgi:hypothetical protein
VSVSNACASTSQGLQVFYRDESQGILLGAVKTSNGWVYEIVDGDKTSEGRTTGDVAFHLSATTDKNTVYLIYDSVLTINSNRDATSGEVRLAIRKTVFPEDWNYLTLDGPDVGSGVAGHSLTLLSIRGNVDAVWIRSRFEQTYRKSVVVRARVSLDDSSTVSFIDPELFGSPQSPLVLGPTMTFFKCELRICSADLTGKIRLLTGKQSTGNKASVVKVGSVSYIVTSLNKVLVSILTKT